MWKPGGSSSRSIGHLLASRLGELICTHLPPAVTGDENHGSRGFAPSPPRPRLSRHTAPALLATMIARGGFGVACEVRGNGAYFTYSYMPDQRQEQSTHQIRAGSSPRLPHTPTHRRLGLLEGRNRTRRGALGVAGEWLGRVGIVTL